MVGLTIVASGCRFNQRPDKSVEKLCLPPVFQP